MLVKRKKSVLGVCAIAGMMLLAPGSHAVSVGDPSIEYSYVRLTQEEPTSNGHGFCEFARKGSKIWATVKVTGLVPGLDANQIVTTWVIVNGVNTGRLDTGLVSGGGDAVLSGNFNLLPGDSVVLKVRDHNTTIQSLGNATPDTAADADLVTEVTTPRGLAGSTKPGECIFSY